MRECARLIHGRRGNLLDPFVPHIPVHDDFIGQRLRRVDKDGTDNRGVDIQLLRWVDNPAAGQRPRQKIYPVDEKVLAAAIYGDLLVLRQKLGSLQLDVALHVDRNRGATLQPEINPALQVLGADNNFLTHLEGFYIDKTTHGSEILAAQIAHAECRVPGVLPIQVELVTAPQIAKIIDPHTQMIDDETNRGAGQLTAAL